MCRANRRWNASEMGTAWDNKCFSCIAARRLQSRNNVRGWWWRGTMEGGIRKRVLLKGAASPQARGLDMGVDLREMDETQGTDRWQSLTDYRIVRRGRMAVNTL